MLVFVERQTLLEGRGLFLPSFPDLGYAAIAASLARSRVGVRFVEGTWRWVDALLADPERLFHGAMRGLVPGMWRRKILSQARQGIPSLEAALARTRAVLRLERADWFFDEPVVREAADWLSATFSLFEAEVRSVGPGNHPLVRRFVREILAYGPDLVAFSLRGDEGPVVRALCQSVTNAGVLTVGGGWASLGADLADLERMRQTFGLTWFAAGSGAWLLPRLHEAVQNGGGGIGSLPNLVGRDIDAPRLEVIDEPVVCQVDFEPFMGRPYLAPEPTLPIASNRGCYWKRCAFCPQRYNRFPYTEAAPDRLAAWVAEQQRRWGVCHFFFVDECIHPDFARRFARALAEEGVRGCRFVAMARPEPAFDEELLREMASMGFKGLLWGVESGSDRVLRLMRKGTKTKTVAAVLERAHRAGVSNFAFLMIGFPGETAREARDTLEFLRRHRDLVDGAQLSRFVVYEASDVGQHPGRYGVDLDPNAPRREVGSVGARGGGLDRAFQDELYREFQVEYASLTSGRVVSFPHHFMSARSLLSFLYRAPSSP